MRLAPFRRHLVMTREMHRTSPPFLLQTALTVICSKFNPLQLSTMPEEAERRIRKTEATKKRRSFTVSDPWAKAVLSLLI